MHLISQRYSSANNSTMCLIFQKMEDGSFKFFCHNVEDDGDGVKGDKRIPEGFYKLGIHKSETPKTLMFRKSLPWFKWFIEVLGIPGFSLVFVHPGNDYLDTEGCQLPNDMMGNNTVTSVKVGGNSRQATERFYALVMPVLESGKEVFYEVRDEYHLWKH